MPTGFGSTSGQFGFGRQFVRAAAAAPIVVNVYFKYGFVDNGYSGYTNGSVSYSNISATQYQLTQSSRYNFTLSGDRGAIVDLGQTVTNSNITIYTGGSTYIYVAYHNGTSTTTSWTTFQSYASVGDGTTYTANITGVSHRYVGFGSGHGGYNFEGITWNSSS